MSKFVILIGVIGAIVLGACELEDPPTATPAPNVSAQQLWEERASNASWFDSERKGSWVRMSGIVREIEGGEVRLYAEDPGFIDVFTKFIALHDLPVEIQASAAKGQNFSAMCKVDNKIWNTMNLRECGR